MSATAADNLEVNPFFKALQTEYKKKYIGAQTPGALICIPQASAVRDAVLTPEWVDNHLLTPSPYRKSHYFSTNRKNKKEYELKENLLFLKIDDKPNDRGLKILAEEYGYNKDFDQFSILIVESPLCPVKKVATVQTDSEKFEAEIQQRTSGVATFAESVKLLNLLREHKQILSIMDKEIIQFRETYMIHESFLPNAAEKLRAIAFNCFEELQMVHTNRSIASALKSLVESYVMGSVDDKVFPVVRYRFAEQDQKFANKLKLLNDRHITAGQLSVAEVFCCSQTEAVVELAAIDSLKTPHEKLLCIVHTVDFIVAAVEQAVKESEHIIRLTTDELPCLTSDELIPILVTVIVQAKLSHLESTLYYLEHFQLFSLSDNKCSFSLVTFQAAVEYIRSSSFTHLQPCHAHLKREMSLKEFMEVTKQIQRQDQVAKDGGKSLTAESIPASSSSSPVVDRELRKITRMIEASTKEMQEMQLQQQQQPGTEHATIHRRTSSLSGLFCSPQQTFCNVSFGKQT